MSANELAVEIERLFTALVREGGRLGYSESDALTSTQRAALIAIVDGGPLRLGAVADALGTTDATATRTVQALERLGLVERTPVTDDRRGIRVAASAEGRKVVAAGRRRLAAAVANVVPAADQARLAALLRDLTGAVAR
ncbi:MAG TPA: MarR family transcriptional regulator [Gaiellaceae bacterium]